MFESCRAHSFCKHFKEGKLLRDTSDRGTLARRYSGRRRDAAPKAVASPTATSSPPGA